MRNDCIVYILIWLYICMSECEYIFVYDKLVWFENISISRTQDNA